MKRHFLAALAVLGYLLFAFLIISYAGELREGSRILNNGADLKIEVPEMCPDFHLWKARLLGSKKYANGNAFGVMEFVNEDQYVFVSGLFAFFKETGKVHCVALLIHYFPPGGFDKNKPIENQIKSEYMEDLQFMQTGKPSGKLSRVKDLTPFSQIERFLNRLEV